MKKTIQRIGILLCAVLLLLSITLFAACNKANQNNSSNNNTPTQPTPVEPNKPKEPYSYQPHLSATLPTIHINTADGSNDFALGDKSFVTRSMQEYPYQQATISITNCADTDKKTDVAAQVKVRGNSTANFIKKPLRIKFETKQSMLSLNDNYAAKDWVLLADWKDVSMLRNNVGLYLGQFLYKDMGLYCSDFRNVEVYLNGTYWGMYLLCEQNEVASERVNINKPANGYTGTDIGYLLELDDYAEFEPATNQLRLNYNNKARLSPYDSPNKDIMPFVGLSMYTIKSKIYDMSQRDFIEKYLENIYRICYKAIIEEKYYTFTADKTDIVESSTINDAFTAVTNVIDLTSIAAVCVLQEIIMDFDINTSSFFLTIDLSATGDGKLRFQAPWDFDTALGWGKPLNGENDSYQKLYAANSNNPWLVLLYKADFVQTAIKEKWQELIDHNVFERLLQYLDTCATKYSEYYKKNFDKWGNIGENIKEQVKGANAAPEGTECRNSFEEIYYLAAPDGSWKAATHVDAKNFLKSWLKCRFDVLNTFWAS